MPKVVALVRWEKATSVLVEGESLAAIEEAAEKAAEEGDLDDLGWGDTGEWKVGSVLFVEGPMAKLVRQGVNSEGRIVDREDVKDA